MLNRIGNVFLNRDQAERALPYHHAALEAFESAGDVAGQANTLELLAVCYYNLPDVLAGAECDERALALARQVDARSVVFHASIHLLLPLRFETEIGPLMQAERLARLGEEALRFARASSWPVGEAQALGLLGGYYSLLGEYGRALPYVYDSLRLAEAIGHGAGISASERLIAALSMDLLAYDEAAARLRRAWSSATNSAAHFFGDIAALALCQALAVRHRKGDLAEAETLLTGLLAGERLSVGRNRREALAVRAEVELALGKPEDALATLEPLIASTCHLGEHRLAGIPRLALLLGRSLAAAGRAGEARDALEAAVTGAQEQGRKPLEWRAHVSLGRLHLDQRERRAAQYQFQQARKLVAELAARIPELGLREDFERRALAMIPLPPPPTERRIAMQAHGGLTEREQSVARLVAAGEPNRKIAEALVISERTAERHVANILDKLGLASRVQLAAWATANLLTP